MKTLLLATLAALATIGLACGEPDPEELLGEATRGVAEAKRGVEQAQAAVEREEDALEKAQGKLADAVDELGEAEDELKAAKDRLAAVADDTYLFRAVQTALLAEPELDGLAISASVEERVVTLHGRVPKLALRKKAGEIARSTLGVESVDNKVTVEPPAPTTP
jgi:osmotically-inducible protein OsmY